MLRYNPNTRQAHSRSVPDGDQASSGSATERYDKVGSAQLNIEAHGLGGLPRKRMRTGDTNQFRESSPVGGSSTAKSKRPGSTISTVNSFDPQSQPAVTGPEEYLRPLSDHEQSYVAIEVERRLEANLIELKGLMNDAATTPKTRRAVGNLLDLLDIAEARWSWGLRLLANEPSGQGGGHANLAFRAWRDKATREREKALSGMQDVTWRAGAITATLDAAQAAMGTMPRSSVRNATTAMLAGTKEFSLDVDQSTIGGIAMGAGAYIGDSAAKAFGEARREVGMDSAIIGVSSAALHPSPRPTRFDGVRLVPESIDHGLAKCFVRDWNETMRMRQDLEKLQKTCNGEGLGSLFHPAVTGALGVARRVAVGAALSNPLVAATATALFSGAARVCSRLGLEAGVQLWKTVSSDDLAPIKGNESLPCFKVRPPTKGWGAVTPSALPREFAKQLALQCRAAFLDTRALGATANNLVAQYLVPGAGANLAAEGFVQLFAPLGAGPGSLLGQFLSSAMGDVFWDALKSTMSLTATQLSTVVQVDRLLVQLEAAKEELQPRRAQRMGSGGAVDIESGAS